MWAFLGNTPALLLVLYLFGFDPSDSTYWFILLLFLIPPALIALPFLLAELERKKYEKDD